MKNSIAREHAAPNVDGLLPARLDKAALRQRLLALRRAACAAAAPCVLERLASVLAQREPRCVGAYAPLPGEFDVLPLLARWLGANSDASAALPVVTAADAPLEFHRWTPDSALMPGRYGIPVPVDAHPLQPDLLLVPCVGYDADGYRLGYGGGFYDRTLARGPSRPFTVGLACAATRQAHLPREPHDLPLDLILSEAADGAAHR